MVNQNRAKSEFYVAKEIFKNKRVGTILTVHFKQERVYDNSLQLDQIRFATTVPCIKFKMLD